MLPLRFRRGAADSENPSHRFPGPRATLPVSQVLLKAFLQELTKLGWNAGKNFTIEYRFAEGKTERMLELAAELVRLKVDLIVTSGAIDTVTAKKATSTIPIVMVSAADPVGSGLVASLARPGGKLPVSRI